MIINWVSLAKHLWLLSVLVTLAGCLSQHDVTVRPEYAFPQNLVSLCNTNNELLIENNGKFDTSGWDGGDKSGLLLSSQLLPDKPEQQRLYRYMRLLITTAPSSMTPELTLFAYDSAGEARSLAFPPENVHCSEDGELSLDFSSSHYYLWASMGTKTKKLALWTNTSRGLVIQNRWKEGHAGIWGGGSISGDAWAEFQPRTLGVAAPVEVRESPDQTGLSRQIEQFAGPGQQRQSTALLAPEEGAGCTNLTGAYQVNGEVINADGSLSTRSARDQFFREEIVGLNITYQKHGSRLNVQQDVSNYGIVMQLFDSEELLVERRFDAANINCMDGKWQIKGEKKLASAWLLLMASGGVSWEDLMIWKDSNGDLLVEGTHKTRNALFLVPMGDTTRLFMVFPHLCSDAAPGCVANQIRCPAGSKSGVGPLQELEARQPQCSIAIQNQPTDSR